VPSADTVILAVAGVTDIVGLEPSAGVVGGVVTGGVVAGGVVAAGCVDAGESALVEKQDVVVKQRKQIVSILFLKLSISVFRQKKSLPLKILYLRQFNSALDQ
jgi:hypothetical protein